MKLYNLYESLILEEINKGKNLLVEGVSDTDVDAAIRGKYNVNILYQDDKGKPPSKRYIQVYNRGETKAGNPAIRAYQIFGGSKTTPKEGAWKIFLLDKINMWEPTNKKWQNPVSDYSTDIPSYNQMGDNSMSIVNTKVDFDTFTRQRSDISQNPDKKIKPSPKLTITNNNNNL